MPDIDTSNLADVQAYVRQLSQLQRGTAGGNTSCVEIRSRGELFVIDAGSGFRELGRQLMNGPFGRGQGKLHLFFSHAHWDHIQGFPFFQPNFVTGNQIFIYSIHNLEKVLHDQQRSVNFPISLSYMQATFHFERLVVGQPRYFGKIKINTIENPHPGRAYSYRFEDEHSSFVYASDAEFKELTDDTKVNPHINFFKGADALIFDAQYTLKESWEKVDWGHSSALIGIDFARAAGVKKLILFHHDPIYSDAQLQEIQTNALAYQDQDASRPKVEVLIGYEGLMLDLAPTGAVELQVIPDQATAVVTPTTIFDEQGVDQLARQLTGLAERGTLSDSIIDLSHVDTLTTATLKMLVTLGQLAENGSIVLASPSESVLRVIELAGYQDFFAIYPSLETAITALQARQALNLPGQTINERYLIEGKIGTSRLGTLLKATDMQLKHTVAVKILSPALSEQTLKRFTRQARQLIDLDQPQVVKVYEVGSEANYTFIVEEFVTDPTLQDLLTADTQPLSVDQSLDIALDITLALEYIHSRGVTHGNLKPENIFLTEHGVKLGGIGLGRLEEGRNLLEAPLLHLTAAYLAPEQILGQPVDARTDLYALGVVLYQLFTGQLPY
ncbi:MAG: protein kinase, partial [Anaerolineae bacterium]|nr:protein kinase [Anaerolineae bacterium]